MLFAVSATALPARSQEFYYNGFADFRVVSPSNIRGWLDGGLGKFRYGSPSKDVDAQLSEVVADLRFLPTPDILAFASVRYAPDQKTALDVTETYLRYQPVSTGWLWWSVRAGMFYPPVSLENEGVGWTSPWTITPSAINSWVGEELRALGAETTAEYRFDGGTVQAVGSVFGWDDPSGTFLTAHGWAFDDRPTGIFDQLRLPDTYAAQIRARAPLSQHPFMETDNEPGWYGALSLRGDGIGRITVLQYDNRTDPKSTRGGQVGWRTEFRSIGVETYIGDVTILAQGMIGDTEFQPSPRFRLATHYKAAYVLAGWDYENWRLAGRFDVFTTHTDASPTLTEHGRALTGALTWRPVNWLRLMSEVMWVDSSRAQRAVGGLPRRTTETQAQLLARILF